MAPSSSASPAKAPPSVSVAHNRLQNRAYSDITRERSESPPPKKLRSMKEIMAVAKHVQLEEEEEEEEEEEHDQGAVVCSGAGKDYENLVCEQCGSGEKDDEILLCDKCDKGFHMLCVRPIVVRVPIGQWFCPSCTADQRCPIKSFSQKKIDDFFRIQKGSELVMKCTSPQDIRRRRKRTLGYHKKRRRLLPFTPTEDPARRLDQMGTLATALTALGMEFSNELTYVTGMARKRANQAKFENGGMQVLSKEDTETLEQCRAMCKSGLWPPLIVVFDSCEGYTVEADAAIKDMTLIAEYTGDVDYIRNRQNDDCDSMMTLLLATDPSKSLVICPDKRGNIARFINGINNHTLGGRKKQNLKCVRYNVNGECRVLLVAIRDISKGERLYYDYNGYEHEYPTHHFV